MAELVDENVSVFFIFCDDRGEEMVCQEIEFFMRCNEGRLQAEWPGVFIERPKQFTVYPNPAQGALFIDLGTGMDEAGQISLRDNLGRLLSEFTVEPATTLMSIDISGLTPGLFFISFSDESTFIETQRVVVVD